MNIIKNRKIYIMISLSIMALGLIMYFVNGLNYGIDFTGGTIIEIKADKFISVEDTKIIIDEFDENASIIHEGQDKKNLIIKSTLDLSNDSVTMIVNKFEESHNIDAKNYQSKKFGPTMGKEIRDKALLSTFIATFAMLLYITFRFQFKFGVAAIGALIHDVLITMSIYVIFKLPINSSFIAAILTIVGYSINDTIVIFDRIREELRLNPKDGDEKVINDSIRYSIRRTIFTTITTLSAVLILYIVGVEDVKVLALPLLLGMISGTYSSIFIAPPFWYQLNNMKTKTAK